jgi:hypothetical protein
MDDERRRGKTPGYRRRDMSWDGQVGQQRTLYISHEFWNQLVEISDHLQWSKSRILDLMFEREFNRSDFTVERFAKRLTESAA